MREDAEGRALGLAVLQEKTLGRPTLAVGVPELRRSALRVDHGHRRASCAGEMAPLRKLLDLVPQLAEEVAPRIRGPDIPREVGGLVPARRVAAQTMFQRVPGEEAVHIEAVAGHAGQVGRDATDGFERRKAGGAVQGVREEFAAHRVDGRFGRRRS